MHCWQANSGTQASVVVGGDAVLLDMTVGCSSAWEW